jgi:hypothetical protein
MERTAMQTEGFDIPPDIAAAGLLAEDTLKWLEQQHPSAQLPERHQNCGTDFEKAYMPSPFLAAIFLSLAMWAGIAMVCWRLLR